MPVQLSVSRSKDPQLPSPHRSASSSAVTCGAYASPTPFPFLWLCSAPPPKQGQDVLIGLCAHPHACTWAHTQPLIALVHGLALFPFSLPNWDLPTTLLSTSAQIIINFCQEKAQTNPHGKLFVSSFDVRKMEDSSWLLKHIRVCY